MEDTYGLAALQSTAQLSSDVKPRNGLHRDELNGCARPLIEEEFLCQDRKQGNRKLIVTVGSPKWSTKEGWDGGGVAYEA
jgi:hypothetical protein